MHELSLIKNLLDTVIKSTVENEITRVSVVRLVVGECHGALPEALEFAFQVLTRDTVCEDAVLEIQKRPAVFLCRECGLEFKAASFPFRCPACGCGGAGLLGGRELYLDYYEGE